MNEKLWDNQEWKLGRTLNYVKAVSHTSIKGLTQVPQETW